MSEDLKGMRCLVTGGCGFIGSHLCDVLLDRGADVVAIDAFTDYYDPLVKRRRAAMLLARQGFRLVEDDLLRADLRTLLLDRDVIFHLAAQPGVRASWGAEFTVYTERNILATQRLLEVMKDCPREGVASRNGAPRRVVFASSSSVYGDAEALPTLEDALRKPLSPYGITKSVCEDLFRVYRRSYGIDYVALRYFTVYGPGQRPDMAFQRLLLAAKKGGTFTVFGDGSQQRDVTYVRDAVAATIAAATAKDAAGEVINIGGGCMIALKDVLDYVQTFASPAFRLDFAVAEKGDARATGASITKAASLLGYKPAVGWRDGIAAQADSMGAGA